MNISINIKLKKSEFNFHRSVTCSQKYPVQTRIQVLEVPGHDRLLSTANSCSKDRLVFTVCQTLDHSVFDRRMSDFNDVKRPFTFIIAS